MNLLEPMWEQMKPSWAEAEAMCNRVSLSNVNISSEPLAHALDSLRRSHSNGGALFSAFRVGECKTFDWFASRNRLAEFGILTSLLRRTEVRNHLPELQIPVEQTTEIASQACSISSVHGFNMDNPFLFDGHLAQSLYAGGAYGQSELDGKAAKQLALAVCEDLFEQRYSEVSLFLSHEPWAPWFYGIAWDWTAFLFDRRKRMFSILAVTDTD